MPILLKANTSVQGLVTTDGWRGYMLPGHELLAPQDATIAAKLRAAGAILLGITNMPDFAASDTTRSTAFGRTGNAYDVRFSPGGSSGGTVTAVTSNQAVLGNGTDTGNSIRMPVATSSLVGIFPTRRLLSIAGIAPLDWQLNYTGPIAPPPPSAGPGRKRPAAHRCPAAGTLTRSYEGVWLASCVHSFPFLLSFRSAAEETASRRAD